MVRLVRIYAESDHTPAGLASLAAAGPLELLQLDYARPRWAAVTGAATPELPELVESFPDAVRSLCSSLFLEPEFRVVSSAGWGNTYLAVERVARALVEGGSPDIPVSAVRGSNLLGILEFMAADKLPLDNVDTGAKWESLKAPLLSADLLLGAGPILTALDEGGRVVVAGCYDGAAPAIAAAMRTFGWSWQQLDCIAGAAAAARAALWPHRHACDALAAGGALPAGQIHPRVAIETNGEFTVDLSHATEQSDAQQLLSWLQAGKPRDPAHLHADVRFDASGAAVARTGPTQLRSTGCTGVRSDNCWRLEVLYQSGFAAESMIEFSPGAAPLRTQIAEAFRSNFVDVADERSLVTVQELAAEDGDSAAASWLHLACRSHERQPCADFAEQVSRFARSNPQVVRLRGGRPAVHVECGLWPARIPRSAVDIAIDTRPAREWE